MIELRQVEQADGGWELQYRYWEEYDERISDSLSANYSKWSPWKKCQLVFRNEAAP